MLCSLLKEDLKSSKLIWMHQIGQIIFSQKKEKCQDKHCTASGKKTTTKKTSSHHQSTVQICEKWQSESCAYIIVSIVTQSQGLIWRRLYII